MSNFILSDPDAVFIHIPKTGGMSIREGLWKDRADGPFTGDWDNRWSDKFCFAFVRHPLDRFVSAFYMFTEGTDRKRPRFPNMHIDTFAERTLNDTDYKVTHSIAHHVLPMTHEFNCLEHADFVGRFERYEKDLEAIKQHLGMKDDWVPRLNRSQRYATWEKVVRDELSPDLRDALIEFYHDDFKELNYAVP